MARGYGLTDISKSKRRPPREAQSEAEKTVHYWWYEYLRANVDYCMCCETNGASGVKELRKTYSHFGDVRSGDYLEWWEATGKKLFEVVPPAVKLYEQGVPLKGPHVLIAIPLELPMNESVDQLRTLLSRAVQFHREKIDARIAPRYVIEAGITPAQLQLNLQLYKAKLANPNGGWAMWAESAGLTHLEPVVLKKDVSRRIRIAQQIVAYAGKGVFPKYDKR